VLVAPPTAPALLLAGAVSPAVLLGPAIGAPVLLAGAVTPPILVGPITVTGGGGGGSGLAGEVWKVLFSNDGEVLLRFDGTIVTGRI